MHRFLRWVLFVSAVGALMPAVAQVPPELRPGAAERQMDRLPQFRTPMPLLQVPSPDVSPPDGAGQIRFVLRELEVEGVTRYSPDSLRGTYAALLGKSVSLADLYAIARQMTIRYRQDGYVLSQVFVPAQSISDGKVRLVAVEGFVARSRFEPPISREGAWYAPYLENVLTDRPLHLDTLERSLLLMNDLPGAYVRSTLIPSSDTSGASDLILEVLNRPGTAGISVDNRGGAALGPLRWSIDADAYDFFGVHERVGARVLSSGDKKMNAATLSAEIPVGGDGHRVTFSLGASRSRPEQDSAVPLELLTDSRSGSVGWAGSVVRTRTYNLTLRAALTGSNNETSMTSFFLTDSEDRIRAVRIGFNADVADRLQGVNLFDVEYSRGVIGMGSSRAGDENLSRTHGRPDFSKLTLYLARLQSIAPRWSILAAVSGQYAFEDLLSPELFGFGGEQFGRGYNPSELVGDHGMATKVELRYAMSTDEPDRGQTFYAFHEYGVVRQRTPEGFAASESGASAGLGVRLSINRSISGYIEAAKPLTRRRAEDDSKSGRVFAGVSIRM